MFDFQKNYDFSEEIADALHTLGGLQGAMKLVLDRLDLPPDDLQHLHALIDAQALYRDRAQTLADQISKFSREVQ